MARFEPKSEFAGWDIVKIDAGHPSRPLDEAKIKILMVSIDAIGLLNPVLVDFTDSGDKCVLRAGFHRLEACRRLGWKRIPFRSRLGQCVEESEQHEDGEEHDVCEQLGVVDENYARHDLSAEERGKLESARAELLERLGFIRGRGGQREGAGAPKPRTPTRGQLKKQLARASDNQTAGPADNPSDGRPARAPRRERMTTGQAPGRRKSVATKIAEETGSSERATRERLSKAEGKPPRRRTREDIKPAPPLPPEPTQDERLDRFQRDYLGSRVVKKAFANFFELDEAHQRIAAAWHRSGQ